MAGKLFSFASFGFLLGVCTRSFVAAHPVYPLIVLAVLLCGLVVARFKTRQFGSTFVCGLALVSSFCFGAVWYSVFDEKIDDRLLSRVGFRVGLEGVVAVEPDVRPQGVMLRLSDVILFDGEEKIPVTGAILLRVPQYPVFAYGDVLSVSGVLKLPEPFSVGEGRVFDYPAYLAKDGIFSVMNSPTITTRATGQGNILFSLLIRAKQSFLSILGRLIQAPEDGLLAGILFGDQRGISKQMNESFRQSGLVHVVVLSGYNLSVVADWIMRATAFLPHAFGLSFGAIGIILYTLMAGASATAVRASIMALLVVLARGVRRQYDVSRALILAGVVMVAVNPKVLVFDRSFQLSFLATIAVIYISPLVEKYFFFVTERLGLRGIIASTIATQFTVLPFLLYTAGTLSVFSLPANVLALPAVPASMFLGACAGILGLFSILIASPVGMLTQWFLSWIIGVSHFFSSLPLSNIVFPAFPFSWVIASYAALFFVVVHLRRKQKEGLLAGPLTDGASRS